MGWNGVCAYGFYHGARRDCDVRRDPTENKILATIAGEELEEIRPHLELVTLDLHTPLITPREPIRFVYFPVTLLGSLVTVLSDGSTVEAGTVGREGMTGIPVMLSASVTSMETVVQVGGDAFRVESALVKQLFDRGKSFHNLVNRYIHALFVIASQSTACNGRHPVNERLARWLLMSADGIGSDNIAITHEYLATMLGVRRPGVTEAATKLQAQGLIRYKRGGVQIIDRAGLEAASCECYGIVKGEFERLFPA
jgi:CRP-like cAMP-binding protein